MDIIMDLFSFVEVNFFSIGYTLLCFFMLAVSYFFKFVMPPDKLYHYTNSEDADGIISSKKFEARTQGLMFCCYYKIKILGMNRGKNANYLFILCDKSFDYLKPINLGLISFILPWTLIKTLMGQWVTTKQGDVIILEIDSLTNFTYIKNISIEKHCGKLALFSYARNVGLFFINIPILCAIYMPFKSAEVFFDNLTVSAIITTSILLVIFLFFRYQGVLNKFFRK